MATEVTGSWYDYDAENTPYWIYQNFGDASKNVDGYWTMIPRSEYNLVFGVGRGWITSREIDEVFLVFAQ